MKYLPTARLIVTSYPYRSFCTSKLALPTDLVIARKVGTAVEDHGQNAQA